MTKNKKGLFEVYVCKRGSEVIYVGEGKLGRHKHCTSGTSHVYGLNKLHFEGVILEVEVVKLFKTKIEAEECESNLIDMYQPLFNIKGKIGYQPAYQKGLEVGRDKVSVRNFYISELKLLKLTDSILKLRLKSFDQLFEYFGNISVLTNNFKLNSFGHYKKLGLKELAIFLRYVADPEACSSWVKVLYKVLYVKLDINLTENFLNLNSKSKTYWNNFIENEKLSEYKD